MIASVNNGTATPTVPGRLVRPATVTGAFMHLRRTTLLALSLLTLPLFAQQITGGRNSDLDRKARIDQDTRPLLSQVTLGAARTELPAVQQAAWNSFQQSAGSWTVLLDRRTGLVSNAMGTGIPTVPGRGNALKMDQVRARLAALGQAPSRTSQVGAEVDANGIRLGEMDLLTRDFFTQHVALFTGVNPAQLVLNDKRSGNFGENGYLWFIDYDQVVNGVRVEGAHLTFRYNHGNLVQFGSDNWGRVHPDATTATLTPAQALQAAKDYLGNWDARRDTVVSAPALGLVAAISYDRNSGDGDRDELGKGYTGRTGRGHYTHKLTYDVTLRRAGQTGTWLVRVSGVDGSVSEMRDINDYGAVKGGVYPGSASGKGTETDIPLPFADYGSGVYADAGGSFSGSTGTTALNGKYVKMNDACGAISQAASGGNIDLSLGSGTDCTTPGGGGAGNTHASRSGYFWIDQIKQKIRSFLPSNSWNNGQVQSNMNLNQTCNAYWDGTAVNFFKSGGGCGNTGELPDVFLHEFGHGFDQHDGMGTAPEGGTGEAYGDSTALTMGHHSCTGPGFLGSNCAGYGDACTACTGVRELDYHKHASGTPWTVAKNASSCPAGSSCLGPMGKECHCESLPLSQGNWDMTQALIAKYGAGAGWYKFDQLWYFGSNTSVSGFTKVTSTTGNGCGSSNWLNVFLVVNDDDGNLANGTPDASVIQAAYNAHGVGCSTLTSTSTQSGAALSTPALSSTSTSSSVALSWGAVSGASSYNVFKNMIGCASGFIKVASSASAGYSDSAVSSAGTYYYAVQAIAGGAISQFSNCIAVTPSGTTSTWAVSGTITDSTAAGISGVTVSYAGGSTTTSATGAWSVSGLANGSYTFTPSKTSYTFTPANRAVSVSGANVTGQNFTGATAAATYSISGSAGSAGATVSYSGPSSSAVAADASGNYSISNLTAGTYTLTPSKSGFTFSPTTLSVTVGPSATGKNFTATSTGGGVPALSNGVALASSVNGASADADFKDFTLAVPSGASNLTIATTLAAGDVDLYVKFGATPSLTVYDCRPYSSSGNESCPFATPSAGTYYIRVYNYATGSLSFSVTGSFTTGTTTYSISGNAGIAGASVSYGASSVTADASGNYSISSLAAGTYTLTPSKSGYTFSPVSLSATVGPSVSGKNFTATASGGGQVERLVNGAFTSGATAWVLPATNTASSSGITTTGTYPHSGTSYAYLGNLVFSASYELYQGVSIPSTATAGSISFWLNVVTNESLTDTGVYDTMTATVQNASGTVLCSLGTWANHNANDNGNTAGSYTQKSFALSASCVTALKGQSVYLDFKGSSDASLGTTFRIDDASFMTN